MDASAFLFVTKVYSNRQPNPAPPKNKMSRDQPRLKSRIRFITMNHSELLCVKYCQLL